MSDVAVEVLAGGVQVEIPAALGVQVEVVPSSTPAFEVSTVPTAGGGGVTPYVHVQAAPSATWIINHNRGAALSCTVFSPGGAIVDAEVVTVSINQVQVLFVAPAAGTARLI
ncbi:MAG TPA: hypothetical protein VE861_00485 [Gemmatimonadaceae bacterium]|nr:hypothetical protein [Gemmatimonadaceae bacterium]